MRTFFLLFIFLLFISDKDIGQNKKGKKVKQQNSIKANDEPDYDWSFCRRVETDAKFGADSTAWNKYLQQHMDTGVPKMNGAPVGTYEIIIQFIVNKDGVINEMMPLTIQDMVWRKKLSVLLKNHQNGCQLLKTAGS